MAVWALVLGTGFLAGLLYMFVSYVAVFHSDSAGHHVLARAMVDQASLVPRDFAYGNQIIVFRNNLFIAPLLALGMEGYRAYAVGSAIAIGVYFLLAFLCVEQFTNGWRRALLATALLFLPVGHTEADFFLGQQSHLSIVVFALAIVTLAWRATGGSRRAAVGCGAIVFMVCMEAPTRATMMLLPLAATLAATHRWRASARLAAAILAGAVAGLVVNRLLVGPRLVEGIPQMPVAMYQHFLARANELARYFIDYYVGFYQFEGQVSRKTVLLLYAIKSAVAVAFIAGAIHYGRAAWRAWRGDAAAARTPVQFLGIAAVANLLVGAFAVAAIEYWLDVRHFLWALMFLKLALILAALEWLSGKTRRRAVVAALALVPALLASTAVAQLLVPQWRAKHRQEVTAHVRLPEFRRIEARIKELGIRRLYGEHWELLRLETLVPGAEPSLIDFQQGEVKFVNFLTRPSRRCAPSQVLYVLDHSRPPQDKMKAVLEAKGGRVVEVLRGDKVLYLGPPVWSQAGCP